MPKNGLTSAWVAIAPTREATWGTSAPTAKNRVATAMPNWPLFQSRAMIDQVTTCLRAPGLVEATQAIRTDQTTKRAT